MDRDSMADLLLDRLPQEGVTKVTSPAIINSLCAVADIVLLPASRPAIRL
jgi:hypothetical protein